MMHRREQMTNANRQSFLARNTRLIDELTNKCCSNFLKTEFLSLVNGRDFLKVAFELIQKQKKLESLTRESYDYQNPYQKHDKLREEPFQFFSRLDRERQQICDGQGEL